MAGATTPLGRLARAPFKLVGAIFWRVMGALQWTVDAVDRWATRWRLSPSGPLSAGRRFVGCAVTVASDACFRAACSRLSRGAAEPVLKATAFDPGLVVMMIGTLGPGGSERQLVETALGLKRSGIERIAVVCSHLEHDWQRFHLNTLQEAGVEVTPLVDSTVSTDFLDAEVAARFGWAFDRLPFGMADVRRYGLELVRRRPALVHLWLDEVNCKAGLAAGCVGVPHIVLSARSMAPYHFALYHAYMRQAYRTVMARVGVRLLNNSAAGAADYGRWLGVPGASIQVIHNGFDFDAMPAWAQRAERRAAFRTGQPVPQAAPLVGGILRFSEEKRPDLWIETALLLAERDPSLHCVLIGDGPMLKPLKQRVEDAGLAARIHLPGHQRDVDSALAAMDVFLLTSRMEGLPNVLVEAQALGVPVVSTDAGGARETFVPGQSGTLVAGANARALADAIGDLLADATRRAAWGRHGEEQVRARFSSARMVEQTRTLYRSTRPGDAESGGQ